MAGRLPRKGRALFTTNFHERKIMELEIKKLRRAIKNMAQLATLCVGELNTMNENEIKEANELIEDMLFESYELADTAEDARIAFSQSS